MSKTIYADYPDQRAYDALPDRILGEILRMDRVNKRLKIHWLSDDKEDDIDLLSKICLS